MQLAFVDSRLDAIRAEMQRLRPLALTEAYDCPQRLVNALVQASLASDLVRSWSLRYGHDSAFCGPMGGGLIPDEVQTSEDATGLALSRSAQGDLWAAGAVYGMPDGLEWLAVLDPRAFDLLPDPALAPQPHILLNLYRGGHGQLGHPLTTLGPAQRQGDMYAAVNADVWPDAQAVVHSTRHAVAVRAVTPGATLLGDTLRAGATAATLALLLTGLAAVAVWQRALQRTRLVHRIATGLRKRQFEPHIQPVVDLATGQCVGGEVLMRWEHPDRGTVSPGEFIDAAERSGLIGAMSDLIMGRAAHRLATLAQAYPDLVFTFNVAPSQLRDGRFADRLHELFGPETLPQHQVMLELTEREAVDPRSQRSLLALRQAGWRIAIDDFGTGQSNLAVLENLPIDRIKVDISFVRGIDAHTERRPVLDAIVQLGHELQVKLIAEGVETQAQWDYLAARGVQAAQGYMIARPMTLKAFTRWLGDRSAGLPAASQPAAADASSEPLPAETERLWRRLGGPGGLDLGNRHFHLRTYAHCFVGSEAVDWLITNEGLSRAQAVRVGRQLMALGLIRHVLDEHDFDDGRLFYRLVDPACAIRPETTAQAGLRDRIRGIEGPALRDHARGWLLHRQCCSGREIVDWTVAAYQVSRGTASQWATELMRQGALRHIYDDQPFSDSAALFRFH